jgi:hypothetical protein
VSGSGRQGRRCSVQNIAALTLVDHLRDLRLAQRSAACSPRLSGVAGQAGAVCCAGWPPSGEWSGRAFRRTFGPRRLRRQSEPALVATQGGYGRTKAIVEAGAVSRHRRPRVGTPGLGTHSTGTGTRRTGSPSTPWRSPPLLGKGGLTPLAGRRRVVAGGSRVPLDHARKLAADGLQLGDLRVDLGDPGA